MRKQLNVPYASQLAPDALKYNNDCGAACVDMLIEYFSALPVTPDEIFEQITKTDRYLYASELRTVLEKYRVPSFWKEGLGLPEIQAAIKSGRPAICLINYGVLVDAGVTERKNFRGGHFVTATGYDDNKITIHDPYQLVGGENLVLDERTFMQSWHGCSAQKNPNGGAVIPMISRNGDDICGSGLVHYGASLYVRSGPGFGYPVIGRIPNKTRVDVVQIDGKWAQVFPDVWISIDPIWVYYMAKWKEINTVRGIDVSKWQEPIRIPWELLLTYGFLFGIVKASMGGGYDKHCDAHAKLITEAGQDLAFYHWVDPIQDWKRQIGFFLDKIFQWKPAFIALDIEQWWADWDKWETYSYRHEIPISAVPRISERDLILACGAMLEELIRYSKYPLDRIVIYIGRWFTEIYPALTQFIIDSGCKLWNASYVGSQDRYYAWDEFITLTDGRKPLLPVEIGECAIWQYASYPKLQCCPIRLDYNEYMGTPRQYQEWLERISPDPDPLQQEFDTALASVQNMRENTQQLELSLQRIWERVQK